MIIMIALMNTIWKLVNLKMSNSQWNTMKANAAEHNPISAKPLAFRRGVGVRLTAGLNDYADWIDGSIKVVPGFYIINC